MRILLCEAKKMFRHQKGFLFVALLLVLTITTVIFFDKPPDADMELYTDQYSHYLSKVRGKLTPDKDSFLRAEAQKRSGAAMELEKCYEDFYNGKLSEAELAKKVSAPELLLQNPKGFELIYAQYAYVRENPSNRFFLSTNGWNALLSDEKLELLLLLFILLLAAPVFCNENQSCMESLLLTQRKGAGYTALCKICLVLCMVFILSLFTFTVKYLFVSVTYGLENGGFPLQSLPYFAESTTSMTLLQAFLCVCACKTFGALVFSVFILFMSVCTRKYALTLFLCTAVVFLPYFGLSAGGAKYYLPPLSFLLGTGYLKGTEQITDPYSGQLTIVFQEIMPSVFIVLFTFTALLSIAMCFVVLKKYTNVWSIKKHRRIAKPVCLLLCTCICVAGLGGCGVREGQGYDIYNMASKDFFENEKYAFEVSYGSDSIELVFKDKITGSTQNLVKSPIRSMMEVTAALYGNGRFVYYAKYDLDKSGQHLVLDRLSIIEVDTTDFSEKTVYEKPIKEGGSRILGIQYKGPSNSRLLFVYAFFLDSESVFFVCGEEILQIDRITGAETLIPITGKGNVAYDGRHLYYINNQYKIVKHDTQKDSKVILSKVTAEHFYLAETEILFRNRQDHDKIYGMSLDGKNVYKLSDRSVLSVRGDDKYLYFTDKTDCKDYRMERDSGEIVLDLK